MVQFEYNGVMKRHDVKVPFSLAGESDMVMVASITEENKIILHRDLSIKLLRQILLSWDEKEHMDTERDKREAGDILKCFDEAGVKAIEPFNKNKRLVYLEERMQTSISNISIDELELSVRAHNCLTEAGTRTIGKLVEQSEKDILGNTRAGRKTLTEIQVKLDELGLQLKQ